MFTLAEAVGPHGSRGSGQSGEVSEKISGSAGWSWSVSNFDSMVCPKDEWRECSRGQGWQELRPKKVFPGLSFPLKETSI